MSDLVENLDCWFSHATCAAKEDDYPHSNLYLLKKLYFPPNKKLHQQTKTMQDGQSQETEDSFAIWFLVVFHTIYKAFGGKS